MKKLYQFLLPLRQIKLAFVSGFNVFDPMLLFKNNNARIEIKNQKKGRVITKKIGTSSKKAIGIRRNF